MGEGSRIVLLSSTTARSAPPNASLYASTKGAINTLVRCLASELGPRGIRVNGLAPGAIETDMAGFLQIPAAREATISQQAFKRVGQPEDVADAMLYLVSHGARWVTGHTLEVSGGTRL
jgi:NAD(P)-dependent dehydrogenase (short-subunit alcohol dehydrogenase family)